MHMAGTKKLFYISELMRKSLASQEVTGKFEYEDLNVQSIEGLTTNDQSLTINGIDTNTIVMKGKNASFLDKKTFESLTVLESVDIELLNEVSKTSGEIIYNRYELQ